jgi:uncharacterized BrkB/YihY/UPF0761 family membrane protein
MTEPVTEQHEGRIKRARRRLDGARQGINERATQVGERVPAARSAVRAYEHDRAVGGEIMAGAIAFRSFVFLLPFVLVIVVALGIAADHTSEGAYGIEQHAGVTGIAAESVTQSARLSSGGRFIALFLGLIALYSTSIALARALRIAHTLAWGTAVPPMKRSWRVALVVVGTATAVYLVVTVVARFRESNRGGDGLVIAILGMFVFAALWLGVSYLLPHGEAPWKALLPGAVLVGVGAMVLELITVFYVSYRISRSSALYGSLGAAIAILAWAYLLARLVVSSAVLNASLYRERDGTT